MVLATDLSGGARRALRRAQHLPLAAGAEVVILHATIRPDSALEARIRHEVSLLRTGLRRAGAGAARVRGELVTGSADTVILEVARREAADLVVLGRHGESNLRRLLLGTTAERVVHAAGAPVLVVAGQPAGPYAHPIVGVGEEASLFALDVALDLVPDPVAVQVLAVGAAGEVEACRRWLDASLAPYQERGVPCTGETRVGDARAVILDASRSDPHDLLVVGANRTTGLVGFRLGSVAAAVLRHARCDVLVARSPGEPR